MQLSTPVTIASLGIGQPVLTNLALHAGWSVYSGATPRYSKNYMNWVQLQGMMTGDDSSFELFTLPIGFRPPTTLFFSVVDGTSYSVIQIDTGGVAQIIIGAKNTYLSLQGIGFFTV